MCGIVGIIGHKPVTERLVAGLKRLEYRGYDSAGVAVIHGGEIHRRRAKGKIVNLDKTISKNPIDGAIGIAHTRWATHGSPSVANAHPHATGRVALVHNGIIENYAEIREKLSHRTFESETDTEVAAHMVDELLSLGKKPEEAIAEAVSQFRGAYALAILISGDKDRLFCARMGSPLAIGLGDGEMYLGSDAIALAPLTDRMIYLEEGDWAELTRTSVSIFDRHGSPVERTTSIVKTDVDVAEKGQYPHFMLKEIFEQPETISMTLAHYVDPLEGKPVLPEGLDFSIINRLAIVACGTAYYAGLTAKPAFERLSGIAVDLDIASEFRYRDPVLTQDTLFVAVSQSGETADTLAALRYAKDQGLKTLALVNVMTSTMAREADIAIGIHCGAEIGVASTKAFTSQVTALSSLAIGAGMMKGRLSDESATRHVRDLIKLPEHVTKAVAASEQIEAIATDLSTASSAFFLGRGPMVSIAMEGALKLKEISYIHAEGYAAGELKHGPIALIETDTPVIIVAPDDALFEKTISNMQEVVARGAKTILFTDSKGAAQIDSSAKSVIALPDAGPLAAPIVQAVGMQLLAYHTAVALGTDVDQPRNLAKSVTVE